MTGQAVALVACPCGTTLAPRPWQPARRKLMALRCPTCGRLGFLRPRDRIGDGWNEAIKAETQFNADRARGNA